MFTTKAIYHPGDRSHVVLGSWGMWSSWGKVGDVPGVVAFGGGTKEGTGKAWPSRERVGRHRNGYPKFFACSSMQDQLLIYGLLFNNY